MSSETTRQLCDEGGRQGADGVEAAARVVDVFDVMRGDFRGGREKYEEKPAALIYSQQIDYAARQWNVHSQECD